jgi:hypothetical protein
VYGSTTSSAGSLILQAMVSVADLDRPRSSDPRWDRTACPYTDGDAAEVITGR